jgi:hypothetical protein
MQSADRDPVAQDGARRTMFMAGLEGAALPCLLPCPIPCLPTHTQLGIDPNNPRTPHTVATFRFRGISGVMHVSWIMRLMWYVCNPYLQNMQPIPRSDLTGGGSGLLLGVDEDVIDGVGQDLDLARG